MPESSICAKNGHPVPMIHLARQFFQHCPLSSATTLRRSNSFSKLTLGPGSRWIVPAHVLMLEEKETIMEGGSKRQHIAKMARRFQAHLGGIPLRQASSFHVTISNAVFDIRLAGGYRPCCRHLLIALSLLRVPRTGGRGKSMYRGPKPVAELKRQR